MNSALSSSKPDHRLGFGILALFSGLLSLATMTVSLQGPSPSGRYLEFFNQHRAAYVVSATLFMTWAVVAVPFVAAVEYLLRSRGRLLARAAAMLSSVGILLLAFGYFMSVGALMSISAAGTPPLPSAPEYQAAIWRNMSFFLSDPGLMAWGLGFLFFGKLAWNSNALPNWVAVLGFVGGIAGLLTLAVYQTPILALLQVACFAVWGLAVGVVIIRSGGQPVPASKVEP